MTDVDVRGLFSSSISLTDPRSFFLYAGAGAGKTAQLVAAIRMATDRCGSSLVARASRVRVITFTNAAAEEIAGRLGHDPLVDVSTVHSFAWSLIRPFTSDIASSLRERLEADLVELRDRESRGRAGTQASERRRYDIERKTHRLATLDAVCRFRYDPARSSPGADGLAHSEVLSIAARLLSQKVVLQEILVGRYPFLFIDEVQDTNKALMEALLTVQAAHPARFCMGFFGDTMQWIYPDGVGRLEDAIGHDWDRPVLGVNFRSSRRVVDLVNSIRRSVDGLQQQHHSDSTGAVRLFIADENAADRLTFEARVRRHMGFVTSDSGWAAGDTVKTLILEHSLAADRYGFSDFRRAFDDAGDLRQQVFSRDRVGSGVVGFLSSQLVPLVDAIERQDSFRIETLLRVNSPLLDATKGYLDPATRARLVAGIRAAVQEIRATLSVDEPSLLSVLGLVHRAGLLVLPDALSFIVEHPDPGDEARNTDEADTDRSLEAWKQAVNVDLKQIARFCKYMAGDAPFDTHQGVKGLEFPRVLAILDDESARGFLFNYGKVFGAAASKKDQENAAVGLETTVDRTLRLFYVVCSRAQESLAVVLYVPQPDTARQHAVKQGWFTDEEIVMGSALVG